MNPQPPFNGAASTRTKEKDSSWILRMIFLGLFSDAFQNNPQAFQQEAEKGLGPADQWDAIIMEAMNGLQDLLTNADSPQRNEPVSTVINRYTGGTLPSGQKSPPGPGSSPAYTFPSGAVAFSDETLLRPELLAAMRKNSTVRSYADEIITKARAAGLDGHMMANQIWQESPGYNPRAVSPTGAKGLGQFMPATARAYGIEGHEFDAHASINASIRYMKRLTENFGDQRLALVAYNGGGKALEFAEGKLGKEVKSIGDFMGIMARERALKGEGPSNAWRNQTFEYVQAIDSTFWSVSRQQRSTQLMAASGLIATDTNTQVARAGLAETFEASRTGERTPPPKLVVTSAAHDSAPKNELGS